MKRAFFASCNEFEDPSARLRGCVNDSKNAREYLVSDWKWDPTDIDVVCDRRATDKAIYAGLNDLGAGWPASLSPETDIAFIGFSMHGSQVADTDGDETDGLEETICPWNFPDIWDDPVSGDRLEVYLKAIPVGVKTVVLSDSCHSGSLAKEVNPHYKRSKFIAPPFDIACRGMHRTLKTRKLGSRGTTVSSGNVHIADHEHIFISGCRDDQTSADADIGGVPQGAMTWAFLTAARQLPGATLRQVHQKMLQLLTAGGYTQTPQLWSPAKWLDIPFSL